MSNLAIFEGLLSIPPVLPSEPKECPGKNEFRDQSQGEHDDTWQNYYDLCQNAPDLEI